MPNFIENRSKKIILKHNCSVLSKSDISELKDAFNPNLPTKLVAIHGPIGCGKTYIVNELAKQTNHTISILIHRRTVRSQKNYSHSLRQKTNLKRT